jgi:DNA-directed RNA polymerase specialized sigma24 family protein
VSTATWFDPAFRQTLVRYARRRVPAAEVEDVVQEALCDALQSSAPSSRPEMLRWSLTILRRRIVDSYRARTRAAHEPDDSAAALAAGAHHPEPGIEARDCLLRLDFTHEAMDLILAESAGDSLELVARNNGITPEAARQRVSRHRRYLRTWLAAAAMLSLLAAFAWDSAPDIHPEPLGVLAGTSLAALDGAYLVESVDPDEALGPVDRELARTLQGATLHVENGVVVARGKVLLTLDTLHGGSLRGHDGHGQSHLVFARGSLRDGERVQLESWSGRFRGHVALRRLP